MQQNALLKTLQSTTAARQSTADTETVAARARRASAVQSQQGYEVVSNRIKALFTINEASRTARHISDLPAVSIDFSDSLSKELPFERFCFETVLFCYPKQKLTLPAEQSQPRERLLDGVCEQALTRVSNLVESKINDLVSELTQKIITPIPHDNAPLGHGRAATEALASLERMKKLGLITPKATDQETLSKLLLEGNIDGAKGVLQSIQSAENSAPLSLEQQRDAVLHRLNVFLGHLRAEGMATRAAEIVATADDVTIHVMKAGQSFLAEGLLAASATALSAPPEEQEIAARTIGMLASVMEQLKYAAVIPDHKKRKVELPANFADAARVLLQQEKFATLASLGRKILSPQLPSKEAPWRNDSSVVELFADLLPPIPAGYQARRDGNTLIAYDGAYKNQEFYTINTKTGEISPTLKFPEPGKLIWAGAFEEGNRRYIFKTDRGYSLRTFENLQFSQPLTFADEGSLEISDAVSTAMVWNEKQLRLHDLTTRRWWTSRPPILGESKDFSHKIVGGRFLPPGPHGKTPVVVDEWGRVSVVELGEKKSLILKELCQVEGFQSTQQNKWAPVSKVDVKVTQRGEIVRLLITPEGDDVRDFFLVDLGPASSMELSTSSTRAISVNTLDAKEEFKRVRDDGEFFITQWNDALCVRSTKTNEFKPVCQIRIPHEEQIEDVSFAGDHGVILMTSHPHLPQHLRVRRYDLPQEALNMLAVSSVKEQVQESVPTPVATEPVVQAPNLGVVKEG